MTIALVLLFIGFLLVFLEFFLPGGIMGAIGALFVLASMIFFAKSVDSVIAVFAYIIGCFVALGLLMRFALWRIRHSSSEYSVYLDKDQEGYYASRYDKSAIGKNGEVLTDLRPGGYITIEGKKYSAISKSGFLPKGTKVKVISGEEESLIVQKEL